MGSPNKSSFLLSLVTSSLGRATGTLLNVQLHSTEGEAEAQVSAWPEASQVGVVETAFDACGSDLEPRTLSILLRLGLFASRTEPHTRSALSEALRSSKLLGAVPSWAPTSRTPPSLALCQALTPLPPPNLHSCPIPLVCPGAHPRPLPAKAGQAAVSAQSL